MARKKLIDPAEIGAEGGRKSRSYMSQDEARALGQGAAKKRWDAYYAAHPEKLKAKLERQARKGKVTRGRPRKK
jgi:hypothetical protein